MIAAGFWQPRLAAKIADAEAFLLLIGPKCIGPWQEVEYFTAFDRYVNDKSFPVVPVFVGDAAAPGLCGGCNGSHLRVVTEDKVLQRIIAELRSENNYTAALYGSWSAACCAVTADLTPTYFSSRRYRARGLLEMPQIGRRLVLLHRQSGRELCRKREQETDGEQRLDFL